MPPTNRDFYEILQVEKNADADAIKKAYRKLAMQFHPDRNPGDKDAEAKFRECAEAYEILSDPEKRSQYDKYGHQAFQGGRSGFSGGGGFNDINDIFSQFGDIFGDIFQGGGGGFGGGGFSRQGRNRNSTRKGADLRYITEIDLVEVIKGAEKEIEFETEAHCEECSGSGAQKGSSPSTCKTCAGQGQVVRQQGFFTMATTCPTCRGTGEMIEKPCKPCGGQGRKPTKRKIKVTLPAGVDNGTRLRVANEGEGGYKGGPNGDLFVEVRVREHDVYEREGDHLFAQLDVSYLQFLLGGEVTTDALDGEVKVEIPRGVDPGERVKVAGRGVPSLRGSRRGDLFFTLQVEFPQELSDAEEALVRALAETSKTKVSNKKRGFFK